MDSGGGWDGNAPANAVQQGVEPDWGVKPGNDPAPDAAPSGLAGAGAELPSARCRDREELATASRNDTWRVAFWPIYPLDKPIFWRRIRSTCAFAVAHRTASGAVAA